MSSSSFLSSKIIASINTCTMPIQTLEAANKKVHLHSSEIKELDKLTSYIYANEEQSVELWTLNDYECKNEKYLEIKVNTVKRFIEYYAKKINNDSMKVNDYFNLGLIKLALRLDVVHNFPFWIENCNLSPAVFAKKAANNVTIKYSLFLI